MTLRSPRPSRLVLLVARAAGRVGVPLRRCARWWRAWRRNARAHAQIELLDAYALRDLGVGFSARHALGAASVSCTSEAEPCR